MQGQPRPWWKKWLAGSDRNERVLKRLTQIPLTVFSDWHSNILHNMPFMSYTTWSYCSERDIFAFEQNRTYSIVQFYLASCVSFAASTFFRKPKEIMSKKKRQLMGKLGLTVTVYRMSSRIRGTNVVKNCTVRLMKNVYVQSYATTADGETKKCLLLVWCNWGTLSLSNFWGGGGGFASVSCIFAI